MLASLLLAGCFGDGLEDLKEFVRNSEADLRGKPFPAPEPKPYHKFVYDNQTNPIPDPFKPRKAKKNSKLELSVDNHPKEDLENFPLESLKMIAFIEDKKNGSNAIIRAPDGRIFRVKAGNYMGMNRGRVVSVTDDKVTITELVLDSEDSGTPRTSTLQLDDLGATQ
jgi:type IV pilus assembly protein PilP